MPHSSQTSIAVSDTPQLPTVQALASLSQQIAASALWRPPHLWKYLKLRRHIDLKRLNPNHIKVIAPKWKVNDCSSCTDSCCIGSHSTVLLRLQDIAALVDLKRTQLLTTQKPLFTFDERRHRPALERQLSSLYWRVFPVLRQNTFAACEALTSEGKCSLYPHWPLSCARFPYSLKIDESAAFYSQRCQSYWIHPDANEKVKAMINKAVEGYNARITDVLLLTFARPQLQELGLLNHINLDAFPI